MKVKFTGKGSEVEALGIGLFKQQEVRELPDNLGYGLSRGNANFIEVKEEEKRAKKKMLVNDFNCSFCKESIQVICDEGKHRIGEEVKQ